MNTKKLIYVLSLVLIAVSIFLVIEYSNSNRMNLIAGATAMVGFSLNILGFLLPSKNLSVNKI